MKAGLPILILALISGCETDGEGPDLSSCTFNDARQCWQCGDCDKWARVSVGCRADNDCLMFCGECNAREYPRCRWGDPPEPPCRDWRPAKLGSTDGCKEGWYRGDPKYGVKEYVCSFCPWAGGIAGHFARSSKGDCVFFVDGSCLAQGYKSEIGCSSGIDSGTTKLDSGTE